MKNKVEQEKENEKKQVEGEKGEFIDTGQLPYLNNGICEAQEVQDSRKSSVDSSAIGGTTLNESTMSSLNEKSGWSDKDVIKEPASTRKKPSRTKSAPAVPSLHDTESLSEASINELDRGEEYLKHVFFFHQKPWRIRRCYVLIAMTSLTYMTIGLNDSAIGALIPQMQEHYNSTSSTMSLCFLANFGGYLISTSLSSFLIHHMQLRFVLMLASAIYIGGSLMGAFAPPFAVIIVSLILTGAGGGLMDVAATSVIMHYEDGPLLTITYSFFSVGSMLSPFLVSGLRAREDKPWNLYFWFPVALSSLLMVLQWFVYASYRAPTEQHSRDDSARRRMSSALTDTTVLVAIVLFFCMMGMQDSWSQWLAKYLEDSKELDGSMANINQACFWAGVTVSRLSLGHFISKWGDMKSAVTLTMAFAFMMTGFWKVNDHLVYGTIILNIICGIFVGPLVPLILATSVERIPHSLKTTATSIIIAGGLIGSTVLPLSLGQAIHRFSTDIIPAVLIVMSFIVLFGFFALFATKFYKRCLNQKNDARTFNNGSLACHLGLKRKRVAHPPRIGDV